MRIRHYGSLFSILVSGCNVRNSIPFVHVEELSSSSRHYPFALGGCRFQCLDVRLIIAMALFVLPEESRVGKWNQLCSSLDNNWRWTSGNGLSLCLRGAALVPSTVGHLIPYSVRTLLALWSGHARA
jgi:hypothetical protein